MPHTKLWASLAAVVIVAFAVLGFTSVLRPGTVFYLTTPHVFAKCMMQSATSCTPAPTGMKSYRSCDGDSIIRPWPVCC